MFEVNVSAGGGGMFKVNVSAGGGGMFEVNVSAGGLPEVVECSRARGLPEVGWKCTKFESTEDHQRLLPTQEEKQYSHTVG